MAALTNARLERYCQNRAVSGSPGGKSKTFAIYAAIAPETGTTEYNLMLSLIGNQATILNARLAELGGETAP